MKRYSPLIGIVCLALAHNAFARDEHKTLLIKDALDTPAAQEKLDSKIKLFFADQPHPQIVKELGTWPTNKKTNAVGKSDVDACNWAFLSAMLSLQERTRKEGGNAVVDIKSNYRNIETASATEYICGAGNIMAGVAFKGTVVKLDE